MEFPSEDEFRQRVRDAIQAGGKVSLMSQKTGIPVGTLNKYVAMTSTPSVENAHKIARALDMTIEQLAFGNVKASGESQLPISEPPPVAQAQEGEKMIERLGAAVEQMTRMVTNASSTMLQRLEPFDPPTVKYIPLQVSAGGGAVVLNDFGMLDLDMDQLATEILRVQRKHMRLTQIKGDSMLPTLADGDIVIVDASRPRKRNEPDEGKIYVLSIEGEMYAKRAEWAEGNNLIWRSDNDLPEYAPIYVRRTEFNSIQIIGEVLWSVRPVHNR